MNFCAIHLANGRSTARPWRRSSRSFCGGKSVRWRHPKRRNPNSRRLHRDLWSAAEAAEGNNENRRVRLSEGILCGFLNSAVLCGLGTLSVHSGCSVGLPLRFQEAERRARTARLDLPFGPRTGRCRRGFRLGRQGRGRDEHGRLNQEGR